MSFEILQILGLIPSSTSQGVLIPPEPLAFVSIQSGGINITDIVKDLTLSNVPIVASTSEHRLQLLLIARENVYSGSNSTAIQDVTRGGISMTFLAAIGTTVPISCGLPDACARMEVWYILNPDVGSEDVVVTTLGTGGGGGSGLIASAWQFNGVNQITPFGAVVSAASQTEQHSLNVSSNIGRSVTAKQSQSAVWYLQTCRGFISQNNRGKMNPRRLIDFLTFQSWDIKDLENAILDVELIRDLETSLNSFIS